MDKIHSRRICVDGRLEVGKIQPILCSFALDKRLCQKVIRSSRIRLHEKINKSIFEKDCPLDRKC